MKHWAQHRGHNNTYNKQISLFSWGLYCSKKGQNINKEIVKICKILNGDMLFGNRKKKTGNRSFCMVRRETTKWYLEKN
jgi:hypothetical protein